MHAQQTFTASFADILTQGLYGCNNPGAGETKQRDDERRREPARVASPAIGSRILVVEDNEEIGRTLVQGFEEHDYRVEWATSGRAARAAASKEPPDVIVLDRLLPDGDGLAILPQLRDDGVSAPIIVLSALTSVEDRVSGLERGADDYVPKPFSFAELLARVRVLLRRGLETATVLEVANLKLDLRARSVARGGTAIELTATQFALLEFLMSHAGEVVSRKMILEHVWEPGVEAVTNVVDVYINRLRNKIDKGSRNPLIHTIRGLGYVLKEG